MTREGITWCWPWTSWIHVVQRLQAQPPRKRQGSRHGIRRSRPFDRIGVVAYEGEAFTSVPITTDHIVVKNGLDQLNTGQLQGGTAIGTGLATAVNRLKGSEAGKVVVLLTDGENNAGQIEPRDAPRWPN